MNRTEALKLLNINKSNPSASEIKQSYKEQIKNYHPDRHPGASGIVLEVIREKFERIQEAKDLLLSMSVHSGQQANHSNQSSQQHSSQQQYHYTSSQNEAYTGLPPSGTWAHNERAVHELKECQRFIERRQFDLALIHAENAQVECPNDYELLTLKFDVLGHLERHHRIETECNEWEKRYPKLRTHYQHRLTLFIALRSQSKNNLALNVINDLIDREGEVPALLGFKANTLMELGHGRKADIIIDRLKIIDPTHPLVQQRSSVMLVGDTYVDKGGAAQDACFICILLECIFDCL